MSSSAAQRRKLPSALPDDWSEFLSLLIKHRVRFIIVGAHALAALGKPRNTLDLDIFVEPSNVNARKLEKAIRAFGFPVLADASHAFAFGKRMARLGIEPLRIDVMNHIDGVSFAAAWAGRARGKVAGLSLHFLGEAEFRRNKRAAGRPKDLLDLALLDE
ncbi:MAG: hypothetical protein IPK60_22195 [Sandaracinaceae bacterium]|nr:hypothetical protein [Sandaracinaceae bacterium]